LMKAAGINVVQVQELPIATLSFDSPARAIANSKADYVFLELDQNSNQSMARSLADTGYKPKFTEYYVYAYGTNFIQAVGAASNGATTWIRMLPSEEASTNKELANYVTWMNRIAPNEPHDSFAADSWVASKAFFDSLQAIPGPITHEALVTQLSHTTTYNAD